MNRKKFLAVQDSSKSIVPCGKLRGHDVYADNPFMTGFEVQIRNDLRIIAGDISITDQSTHEVDCGLIGMVKRVDAEQFVKLYTKNLSLIFELSSYAQRVLIAVFAAVQDQSKDKAEIFLSHSKAVEYYVQQGLNPPNKSYFSKGMNKLLEIGFLAQHKNGTGWYWINPNLIFNGDRIRFITEYQVKRKKEQQVSLFDVKGLQS